MISSSNLPSVKDVRLIEGAGPWQTKSGGELNVLFQFPLETIQEHYFKYEQPELQTIPKDIRGLRTYVVSGIPKGTVGANEWHRNRNELVFALKGSVSWSCEDTFGNKRSFTLSKGVGVWTPPFILHAYEANEDDSQLLVICNTMYMPEDSATHDSFSAEEFRQLQKQFS